MMLYVMPRSAMTKGTCVMKATALGDTSICAGTHCISMIDKYRRPPRSSEQSSQPAYLSLLGEEHEEAEQPQATDDRQKDERDLPLPEVGR